MEKSAHSGCAAVVSGVNANVLGLERRFSKPANDAVLWVAEATTASFAVAAEQRIGKCQCKQAVRPAAAVVLVWTGRRFLLGSRRTRRTTSHPSAKARFSAAAAIPRWLRGRDSLTAFGQDHHLRGKPRQAQADDQAGRDQPSSCTVKVTHHINYSFRQDAGVRIMRKSRISARSDRTDCDPSTHRSCTRHSCFPNDPHSRCHFSAVNNSVGSYRHRVNRNHRHNRSLGTDFPVIRVVATFSPHWFAPITTPVTKLGFREDAWCRESLMPETADFRRFWLCG